MAKKSPGRAFIVKDYKLLLRLKEIEDRFLDDDDFVFDSFDISRYRKSYYTLKAKYGEAIRETCVSGYALDINSVRMMRLIDTYLDDKAKKLYSEFEAKGRKGMTTAEEEQYHRMIGICYYLIDPWHFYGPDYSGAPEIKELVDEAKAAIFGRYKDQTNHP